MKKRRILALALAALSLASVAGMTACKPEEGFEGEYDFIYNINDPSRLKIKVKNFGLGPGNEWLYQTADRFAKEKMETTYGDKTGVYIDIEPNSQQNTSAMAGDSTNIFFDERQSDPYALAKNGLLLNLDSIVKDTTRVGGSLESKIFAAAKGGIMGDDGSYYALPHYEFFPGLAFNRNTFDELFAYFAADDEENVYEYISDKGYGSANFVGDLTAKKSVGPDGKTGVIDGVDYSRDDGLPRSLDELILLCDFIKVESDNEIAPVTVSGKYYNYYPEYLVMGIWSSIAGAEQMRNYYNCMGEIEVVKRDANGNLLYTNENLFKGISYIKKPQTEWVTMSADGKDGWKGNDMAAKYYAIAMLDIMRTEGFFSETAYGGKDHWTTQKDLFMEGKHATNQSAMLVEGSYWYNESSDVGNFDDYQDEVGTLDTLKVEWMNLPTSVYAEGAVGRDAAYLDCGLAYAMINGNIAGNAALKQACLDFVAFCYSEQELKNFTLQTGITRAISYDLSETEKASMSHYAKSLWEARDHEAGSNIIAWSGTTNTFKQMKSQLKLDLDCGVFMCGSATKISGFLKNQHAADAFAACAKYGKWDIK